MKQWFFVLMCVLLCTIFCGYGQAVSPLLSTHYSQGFPFNGKCPANSASGCGAIAIAQILKCYEAPAHGYGAMTYYSSSLGDSIHVDFSTTDFLWNNILDEYYTGTFNDVQAQALAELVFACGAAMYSNYGASTSVNNYAKMMYGLQHYLHISPSSRYLQRKYYSTEQWLEMLNANLRAGHPVFYRGSWKNDGSNVGHMFVIDGIDDSGNYHFNFGHGGKDDKFSSLEIINQNGTFPGGRPVCYNASQAMVIDCFPTPEFDDYPMQICMSDEPIQLNKGYDTSSLVALGEKFTLSCRLRNICHEKSAINYGWALVKNGVVIDQLSSSSYTLSPGNTFKESAHISLSLPKDLENGDYQLKLRSKLRAASEWQFVWENAQSTVNVIVSNNNALIIVPDHHNGDPRLRLMENIIETDTEFYDSAPARSFRLHISNPTINNFENVVRLEIVTSDGKTYYYEAILSIYSQTCTEFHVAIPETVVPLKGLTIKGVRAYYYYELEDKYIELTKNDNASLISIPTTSESTLSVYDLNGQFIGFVSNSVGDKSGHSQKSVFYGLRRNRGGR